MSSATLLPAAAGVILLGLAQEFNAHAASLPSGFLPFSGWPEGTRRTLALWIAYAALLWSAPRVLSRPGAKRRFAWAVFALGVLIALVGLVQQGQGNTALYGLRPINGPAVPFGPYVNADHAACMLTMSAFLGTGLLCSRFSSRRPGSSIADLAATQLMLICALSIIGVGIIETRSRGAFVSLAGATWITLLLLTLRRRSRLAASGLLLCGLFIVAAIIRHPEWLGFKGGAFDYSTLVRLSIYRSSWRMALDFPVFGVGLGAMQGAFRPYQEGFLLPWLVDHAHNDWLELLVETGLVGLAGVLYIIVRFAASVAQSLTHSTENGAVLRTGAAASLIAFGLHSWVEFNFQIPANAFLALAISGLLCAR